MRRLIVLWVVLSLAVTGCAGATGVWEESFDATGNWQVSSDASAEVAVTGGQLLIEVKTPNQLAWASAGRTYSNFRLTVEATQLAGPDDNAYGILARMDKDDRFYTFSISGDGYVRVALYDKGAWTLLGGDWRPSAAIHQGQATNVLALDVQGGQLQFSVNGEVVSEVTDTTLSRGDIGFYAGSFSEPDVMIAFDNLRVEPLP